MEGKGREKSSNNTGWDKSLNLSQLCHSTLSKVISHLQGANSVTDKMYLGYNKKGLCSPTAYITEAYL